MIHRALFGSFERFIGILIEETGGELPVWLAPVQAIALPIADRHLELRRPPPTACADGIRVEIDERTESVGRKIRDAELQKIPYMLVIGDNEAQDGKVALRRHGDGDQGTVGVGRARRAARRRVGPGRVAPAQHNSATPATAATAAASPTAARRRSSRAPGRRGDRSLRDTANVRRSTNATVPLGPSIRSWPPRTASAIAPIDTPAGSEGRSMQRARRAPVSSARTNGALPMPS